MENFQVWIDHHERQLLKISNYDLESIIWMFYYSTKLNSAFFGNDHFKALNCMFSITLGYIFLM